MVATYELLARPGRSGRQLASADYAEALAAVGGMVEADGGHDWLVGNRVYMQVRIEADPSDCILQVRFFLQYAMATRLAAGVASTRVRRGRGGGSGSPGSQRTR